MFVLFIAGILLALLCMFMGFRALRRKRLISDMPTSKAMGVFIGMAELKGTAESDAPLTSNLAGASCVYYSYSVDEHWSRTVTESYTDAKGNHQTRTKTESGWKTVESNTLSAPFYLKDDTGIVRIVPEGAKIQPLKIFQKECRPGDDLYYGKGPPGQVANSTHVRRFTENGLPLHTALYVFGQARERQDVAAAEIARDKNSEIFLISTKSEKQVSSGFGGAVWAWMIAALLLVIGAGILLNYNQLTGGVNIGAGIGTAIGIYIGALLVGWFWSVYNSLVNLRHLVEQGWSQVDIQLKRRHDLIPNLENAVKGYRDYENELQTLLAELRTQAEATPPGKPGPDPKGISPALRVIAERYPELKASESFLSLQKSLVDTEERIALARDYFNNIVTAYNTRLEIALDRFAAAAGGFRKRALMSAADFERAPVEVKLAE